MIFDVLAFLGVNEQVEILLIAVFRGFDLDLVYAGSQAATCLAIDFQRVDHGRSLFQSSIKVEIISGQLLPSLSLDVDGCQVVASFSLALPAFDSQILANFTIGSLADFSLGDLQIPVDLVDMLFA